MLLRAISYLEMNNDTFFPSRIFIQKGNVFFGAKFYEIEFQIDF